MIGRKTPAEVRAELEAALGAGPAGEGEVAESLRRFLSAGGDASREVPRQAGNGTPIPPAVLSCPRRRLPSMNKDGRPAAGVDAALSPEAWLCIGAWVL